MTWPAITIYEPPLIPSGRPSTPLPVKPQKKRLTHCVQCGSALPKRRRKYCTNDCYALSRAAYQKAYQKGYKRVKQTKGTTYSQRSRLRRILKNHDLAS